MAAFEGELADAAGEQKGEMTYTWHFGRNAE